MLQRRESRADVCRIEVRRKELQHKKSVEASNKLADVDVVEARQTALKMNLQINLSMNWARTQRRDHSRVDYGGAYRKRERLRDQKANL